ncbi:uncharacterized protein LY89DRAFT_681227 [Mollisia scopiformis]|uniref:VWFA domain-containing protein n=1 Tax=Mollisia scopiformis TaxID=149040 RepID=A0A194XNK7_MOLSC|nr:uncharacterized protein LY89DRAFT_681227 [Mollisia scopiformis]KUJ21835.1 hypothetical protein LY89DRAFT_681227 [Mollisia scopiformis]
MPSGSAWSLSPQDAAPHRSIFGSLRKLGRKNSNASTTSNPSRTPSPSSTMGRSNPFSPEDVGRNPLSNPSPATRRPDRPGMNAFTVPSNEPPPAYTPSPTTPTAAQTFELPASSAPVPTPVATHHSGGEDPYSFLATFDTTLLIDDSGSMAGRSWREVSQALSTIAPIVTKHDSDGIDIYFLNHKSSNPGAVNDGIAAGGYRGIKRAATITEIFERVRPGGGTPTGIRIHNILKPYLAKLEKETAEGREMKPLNLIVLTDGVPSDDVESVLLSAAKKLDKLDAPPFQVGVQFFQVGNEEGAKEALEELDDGISELVEGGVRDMVDTVTWTGGVASSEGGVGLTGDGILKCVLGAVVKRLDRRRASGEVRRS